MLNRLHRNKRESQARLINALLRKRPGNTPPRFCLFLGAGCSVSSGIPTAHGIVDILKQLCFVRSKRRSKGAIRRREGEDLTAFLIRSRSLVKADPVAFQEYCRRMESKFRKRLFEEKDFKLDYAIDRVREADEPHLRDQCWKDSVYGLWFEEFSSDPHERQQLIEEIIDRSQPNGAYILLAQLVKMGYARNVFTTNFDDHLHDALNTYFGVKPRVYAHNEIAQYVRFDSTRPNIIKLHGDFLYENIKNLQQETRILDPNMQLKFREALTSQDIIILGYSGADRSVMDNLAKILRERKFSIYWCARNEATLHWRAIRLLNACDNGYFVRIADFDQFILELFNATNSEVTVDLVSKAKNIESMMKTFLTNFQERRFKRSNKLSPHEYAPVDRIEDGEDLLRVMQAPTITRASLLKYFQMLHELNRTHVGLIINYALVHLEDRNYSESLRLLKEAKRLEPGSFLVHYNLGVVYHDMRSDREASREFRAAVSIDPGHANAWNNLAIAFNAMGYYAKALTAIDKAISIDAIAQFFINKGVILKNTGQLREAIGCYDHVLKGRSDKSRALYNKANALRLLNEYSLAERAAKRALTLDPDNGYIYATIAEIHSEQGQTNAFYASMTEAVKRDFPLWRHLNDRAVKPHRRSAVVRKLLEEYAPPNIR